jgi:hypothetical protein
MWRRFGAILAGAVTAIVLSLATDVALRSAGIFPELGQPMAASLYVLATVYRGLYGIAGSYIAARLAPDRPMMHALVLGTLGLVATIGGVIETWDKGPEFGPKWYPIALVVLAMPQAWVGGRLREIQNRS